MTQDEVVQQVQALCQLVMANYERPDWNVMVGPADEKAKVKLDIHLQDVLTLAERKVHITRWSVPSNSTADYYDVIQLHDGSLECECKGFRYRRTCSHVDYILDTELDERQDSLFPRAEGSLPITYRLNEILNATLGMMILHDGNMQIASLHTTDDLMVAELYGLLTWLDQNGGAIAALRKISENPQQWGAILREKTGYLERGWSPPPDAGLDLGPPVDPVSTDTPDLSSYTAEDMYGHADQQIPLTEHEGALPW